MTEPLEITVACGDYDRTAPLANGEVPVEGVRLRWLRTPPAQTFWRMIRHGDFDVSEMSLSAHIMGLASGDWPFVGIPVFPSRVFRHSYIYVHERSGIERPEDLKGRRVGVPEYHMTAALFIRGLLSDEYGVRAGDVRWVQGGQHQAGRKERMELSLPDSIDLTIEEGRTIDEMLLEGDLDAVTTAYVPDSYASGAPGVRRLFERPREVELDYFKRTGIFPIMHLVAIKRDLYERNPWLAKNLTDAFVEAKRLCMESLSGQGASPSCLPFFQYDYEDTVESFGQDFWPYGLEANRAVLEAAARYSEEQGLSSRRVSPEELFAPNSLDSAID